jgi:hypothetical protein
MNILGTKSFILLTMYGSNPGLTLLLFNEISYLWRVTETMLTIFDSRIKKANFFQHLSPLKRSQQSGECAKLPKIVNRNAFTIAMPVNETKNARHTSDLIGNNYSPFAKALSTRLLGHKSKSDGRSPLFFKLFK